MHLPEINYIFVNMVEPAGSREELDEIHQLGNISQHPSQNICYSLSLIKIILYSFTNRLCHISSFVTVLEYSWMDVRNIAKRLLGLKEVGSISPTPAFMSTHPCEWVLDTTCWGELVRQAPRSTGTGNLPWWSSQCTVMCGFAHVDGCHRSTV